MTSSDTLSFFVNGQKVVERDPDPEENLLVYLRRKLHLTGTKESCGQGACGACTVMVSRYLRQQQKVTHFAVTACLTPVCAVHGLSVTTVEGVGSVNTKLHPVQEMLVQAHGTQCGFCTPGFVMSMYTLLRNNPKPSMEDVQRALKGNLCRCTGYRPILDAFRPFTKDFCPMGDRCCQRTSLEDNTTSTKTSVMPDKLYDPSQDPIFPSELQLCDDLDQQSLSFHSGSVSWIRPTSLSQLLNTKRQYPGSKVVAGNTTLGLQRRFEDKHYQVLISGSQVAELQEIVAVDTGLKFGACVTLATIEDYICDFLNGCSDNKDPKYRSLIAFQEMLETFAALQVKNMAYRPRRVGQYYRFILVTCPLPQRFLVCAVQTLGGCVASAWSNSDVVPLLCALGARVYVAAKDTEVRMVCVTPEFFQGHGRSIVKDSDVIIAVDIPFLSKDQYAFSLKQSRRDFDTAIVSTAALITIDSGSDVIKDIRVYYGNLLPTVYMAGKLSNGMTKKSCDITMVDTALSLLQEDFQTIRSEGGEVGVDVQSLTEAATWQLMMKLLQQHKGSQTIPPDVQSALTPLAAGLPRGTQVYEEVPEGQSPDDAVGRPIPHLAARQQATGEAQYIDDIPRVENELFLALVTSTQGHANVLDLDAAEALRVLGVVDFLTAKDVPGSNNYGPGVPDETVFADGKVTSVGHTLGAVLATTQEIAESAATLVQVKYEPLKCITTIQEAIDDNSYFEGGASYKSGDTDIGFRDSDVVVEGEMELGGQEHFYMETQRVLAVPLKEDQQINVYGPFQWAMAAQKTVAETLAIPYNKVTVVTKRAGGAFGGKETKFMVTLPVAVGAFKHKRAVRCVLDRDSDMQLTGGRHPVRAVYKVGAMKDGEIRALEVDYYVNAGHTHDASLTVLTAMLMNFDNCYRVPNVKLRSFACKTNLPSNTAMRGFGQPQAVMVTETWMTHVAESLGISPKQIRERNLYKVGDRLHFNCSSESLTLDRCWAETEERSNFGQRQMEIEAFNRVNKYRKKGLAIGPMKFGMFIPVAMFNQGQALVNIYLDGSVLVHHGGSEVGQGVYTKILQVASRALGQPISRFHTSSSNTDIVNNASVSGGSATTDMNGFAVMDACHKLLERLKPYKEANPSGTWTDWVNAAYLDRVSLSAAGTYKSSVPNLGYDWNTGEGVPFSFFACGAACTEVEVDTLTGQHAVTRTDVVMDVGRSLNPAIDIGQIEGAFMQGYGLYALEDLRFDSDGKLATRNALGYKIPVIANVPKTFNISLLKGAPNPKAVYSSKAIGEPPLLLASTVAMAIRAAIKSYRDERSLKGHFQLNCPTTPDKVRALCPK